VSAPQAHLLPIDAHIGGRANAQANAVALDGGNHDPDALADHDLFARAPSKHKHGLPSLMPASCPRPVPEADASQS
jgi:hypothetical protein